MNSVRFIIPEMAIKGHLSFTDFIPRCCLLMSSAFYSCQPVQVFYPECVCNFSGISCCFQTALLSKLDKFTSFLCDSVPASLWKMG